MKYFIKFAVGTLTFLFFTFLMFSSDNDKNIKDDMKNIEKGEAGDVVSFNDGITGEMAFLQAKLINIEKSIESGGRISNEASRRDAQVLRDEATRIKGVFINLTPVGSGGSEMLSSAIKFTDACLVYAEVIINDDVDGLISSGKDIEDAENEFIATQENFARRNNVILKDRVDPNQFR